PRGRTRNVRADPTRRGRPDGADGLTDSLTEWPGQGRSGSPNCTTHGRRGSRGGRARSAPARRHGRILARPPRTRTGRLGPVYRAAPYPSAGRGDPRLTR